jgi:serine/threonine protein kinase
VIPGSHIGQYRILRKLGAGGMGTVFLAEHILLGRQAAIKTLLPTLSIHKEIVERFFTEARATSSIADPGVVQVFDFGYHVDGTAYIVMELLEGEALSDRMDRLGALPQADALKIARQVAAALAAAHDRGIVHRDLKPENLYLVHDAEAQGGERVKILDFGICKLAGDDKLTQSGTTLGTPVYMSPEQCRGTGGVDARSDIYALGCVLFHMLTGRTPFECEGVGEYIVAHLQQEPPIATTITPGLHALIDVLLLRCLAKDPAERYQTMQELQEAIGEVMSKISAPGIAPVVPPGAPVLGEGFRSGNDVEEPARPSKHKATPDKWFVETPVPGAITTGQLTSGETLPMTRMPLSRRLAVVAVVLGAIIAGLFATRAALAPDDAIAAGPEVPPAESKTAAEPEPQTIDAEIGVAASKPVDTAIAVDTASAAAPAVEAVVPPEPITPPVAKLATAVTDSAAGSAVAAPKAVAKPRPARTTTRPTRPTRRSVTATNDDTTEEPPRREPPKLVAPPTPSEDLYDTR